MQVTLKSQNVFMPDYLAVDGCSIFSDYRTRALLGFAAGQLAKSALRF